MTELRDLDTTAGSRDELDGDTRPAVAITAPKPRDERCGKLPLDYITATTRAGAIPYVVSTFDMCEDDVEVENAILSGLDPDDVSVLQDASGLLLTGGGDVDPAFYGQDPHPRTYNVSRRRDLFEFNLLDEALGRDMPVLAICRGMQVLNVHLGGTLEQHLLDAPGRLEHFRDRPRAEPAHEVHLGRNGMLARWIGERADVNSHHHQGVGQLGRGLEEAGRSEDGVLEAIVSRDHTWVVGVQWHPEVMAPMDGNELGLFSAFVAAAARHESLTSGARSG